MIIKRLTAGVLQVFPFPAGARGAVRGSIEERKLGFKIKISAELKAQVGSGSLVVELEVDTREEEGWQEVVVYSTNGGHIIHRSEHILEVD